MRKILLVGNPNVGKSAIFSRLTGIHVVASNYPGTTVEFTQGTMKIGEERAILIDVPGTYDLDAALNAEKIAVDMLEHGDMAINVVDATNLERNLHVTLHLIEKNIPVIKLKYEHSPESTLRIFHDSYLFPLSTLTLKVSSFSGARSFSHGRTYFKLISVSPGPTALKTHRSLPASPIITRPVSCLVI